MVKFHQLIKIREIELEKIVWRPLYIYFDYMCLKFVLFKISHVEKLSFIEFFFTEVVLIEVF